jgi:hypothetical protein
MSSSTIDQFIGPPSDLFAGSPAPSAAGPAAADAIAAAKEASVGQLLFRAARLFNELALDRLHAQTGHRLRPAHTALFPHIELSGSRVTDIARRAGVSKQAVAVLVDELVEMGALSRAPDPRDGRARLVRFATAPDGRSGLLHGLALLGELEEELAAELGPGSWAALHGALRALVPALAARSPAPP